MSRSLPLPALFGAILLSILPPAFAEGLPSPEPAPGSTARFLPIAGDAFAGSSINVVSGLQNTLFTHGTMQYAAFYAADDTLVLARRQLGSDVWETHRTQYRGGTADAHRSVSVIVDGAGYLHVSWDHHNDPLNYARSTTPGSLELGPREPMTGQRENRVTYPAFLRLRDGGLLCFYRDGGSGQGNLVLDRYDLATRKWTQLHASLIDGERARSAYPSFAVDGRGNVHLAWVWRETPDVATNHDLAYAMSKDGGTTWETAAGAPLTIPITQASADYALRIPQNSNLMNPPTVAADGSGHAVLADYWNAAGTQVPQYHLVRWDGTAWRTSVVTHRETPFDLAGTNTKHPPLSRSQLFLHTASRRTLQAYLVYRDDERGGRAVLASTTNLLGEAPEWTFTDITVGSLGGWEPSSDPEQWRRMMQIHMLVQAVVQRDGDDRDAAGVPPSTIGDLLWSPVAAGVTETGVRPAGAPLAVPQAGTFEQPVVAADVLALLERAADWQLAQPEEEVSAKNYRDPRGWVMAPFYVGALELAKVSPSPRFHDALMARFDRYGWAPAPHPYFADDYCVAQAYLELYLQHHDLRMLKPSQDNFEAVLAKPPATPLDWGMRGSQDRWSWCDALFMGPVSWLEMWRATGDRRYLDYMNQEWWATTAALYVPGDRLFARDESFLDLRERNGRGLYWSRGNGWVVAGLARVLERFPKDHPDYPRYVQLYRDMMEAVLAAQRPDGLWRPGLLDPDSHPARETSGSSFYVFALAWGINNGLLDRARVEPVVRRGWMALASCVTPEGKLQDVQPIGAAPQGFDPTNSEPFGVGAFLLAGCEVYRMVKPAP